MNSEPAIPHLGQDIVGVQKLKNWHEHVADFILLNPTATRQEIADHFQMHVNTIIRVCNSDLFKMYLERRKQSFFDKVDDTAVDRIQRKLHGVIERGLDVLDEKIQNERRTIGIDAVRDTLEMTLKAVGYGTSPKGSAPQTQVTVVVGRDALEEARALHAQRREALQAPSEPESSQPTLIEQRATTAEDIDL